MARRLTNAEFMDALTDFFVEDILAMSDEEIDAELIEDGLDPKIVAAEMRQTVERILRETKGTRHE